MDTKPKRFRPKFSVRTLVILVTLACCYAACWGPTKTRGVEDMWLHLGTNRAGDNPTVEFSPATSVKAWPLVPRLSGTLFTHRELQQTKIGDRLRTCARIRKTKWRKCMGIEPTGAAFIATPNGFENRGHHQVCKHFRNRLFPAYTNCNSFAIRSRSRNRRTTGRSPAQRGRDRFQAAKLMAKVLARRRQSACVPMRRRVATACRSQA